MQNKLHHITSTDHYIQRSMHADVLVVCFRKTSILFQSRISLNITYSRAKTVDYTECFRSTSLSL